MKIICNRPYSLRIVLLFAILTGLFSSLTTSSMEITDNQIPPGQEQTGAVVNAKTSSSFDPKDYVLPEDNGDSKRYSDADQITYELRVRQENIRLYEVILLVVMALCALAIVLKYMKDSKSCNARDMLNGTGLVLVIFSTVLVIVIANAEIQLTAAMGVLGGIAGYLFGTLRSSAPGDVDKKQQKHDAEEPKGEHSNFLPLKDT